MNALRLSAEFVKFTYAEFDVVEDTILVIVAVPDESVKS